MPQVSSAVTVRQKVPTLMSQNFRLNFVQQNDSTVSFLSAFVYLFYALISEYIETLNCLNFSKNWKNGGVLKLLIGIVYIRYNICVYKITFEAVSPLIYYMKSA